MGTTTRIRPTTSGWPAEGSADIALGDDRLVIAGDGRDDRLSGTAADGLPFAERRRSAITVLDFDRQAYVVFPGIAPDHEGIALIGELDLAGAHLFESAVDAALRLRPARVVLDLRRLEFIDGRGARTVGAAAARLREWDGSLLARGALPPVARLLGLCGLGALTEPVPQRSPSPRWTTPELVA
jgi:anti-anti-sigma factor